MCPKEKKEPLGKNHDVLIKHLTQTHSQRIKQSHFEFKSLEEFEARRSQENRDVKYACSGTSKTNSITTRKYYDCNRSDIRGKFLSKCQVLVMSVPRYQTRRGGGGIYPPAPALPLLNKFL